MNWPALLETPAWLPLSAITLPLTRLTRSLYALGNDAYLFVVPYASDMVPTPAGPFVTQVAWAASTAAALRAFAHQVEDDDGANAAPPPALLPTPVATTYASLYRAARVVAPTSTLESARYRLGVDGAFVHRVLSIGQTDFFFRGLSSRRVGVPYAISRRLSTPVTKGPTSHGAA